MSTVITVENLGKKYTISHQQREEYSSLRDVITNSVASLGKKFIQPFRSSLATCPLPHAPASEDFWALKDVSFEVKQGDRIGIIGRNGAGKSTLLKILSRITEPTTGSVRIKGRVASLLEVGTGFHPELTGRENIFLNGAILGMHREEIRRKFDEIVDFAEIEKFLDTPVKRYSSGMYVRLAFAVAAHLEPEILVVDEVLAVGDVAFQKKCLGRMEEAGKEGRTVLFVSHNMAAIRSLCPQSIFLSSGAVVDQGKTLEIIDNYLKQIGTSRCDSEMFFADNPEKEFQIRHARLVDCQNSVCSNFTADDEILIELDCHLRCLIPGLYGYMVLTRSDGTTVVESDSFDVLPNQLDNLPLGRHTLRVVIPPRTIGVGDYTVYFNFTSPLGLKTFNIDTPGQIMSFRLDDPLTNRGNRRNGFFSTRLTWEVATPCHYRE